jgi:hypothetical protein
MTIAAIDPVIARVMLVAELNGLFPRNVLIRPVWRARNPQNAQKAHRSQKRSRDQTESGNKIRAAMKNLGHVSVAL